MKAPKLVNKFFCHFHLLKLTAPISPQQVFDCLQLNTPPPVMSACLAPPNRPDPFRASGPHPTRDLGCPEWRPQPVHSPMQPSRAILQLTQEEDQAITNLLKLHHQDTGQSEETLNAAQMDFSGPAEPPVNSNPCLLPSHPQPIDSTSGEEVYKPCGSDVRYLKKAGSGSQLQQVRGWSDEELEAVDTLLSRFSLTEEDGIWGQRYQKSAATLPDPLPYQYNRDFPTSSETQQESEALPVLKATQSTQNDTGYNRFTCVGENGEPGWGDFRFVEDTSARGDFPEARERMISDLEGDAVHVLLSFGEMETSDILQ